MQSSIEHIRICRSSKVGKSEAQKHKEKAQEHRIRYNLLIRGGFHLFVWELCPVLRLVFVQVKRTETQNIKTRSAFV